MPSFRMRAQLLGGMRIPELGPALPRELVWIRHHGTIATSPRIVEAVTATGAPDLPPHATARELRCPSQPTPPSDPRAPIPVPLHLIVQPESGYRNPSQTAGRGHIGQLLPDVPPTPRHAGRRATRSRRLNRLCRRLQHGTPIVHRRCTLGRAVRP